MRPCQGSRPRQGNVLLLLHANPCVLTFDAQQAPEHAHQPRWQCVRHAITCGPPASHSSPAARHLPLVTACPCAPALQVTLS
jgi:hypothetical protein